MQLVVFPAPYADFLLVAQNVAGKHGVVFFASALNSFAINVIVGDTAIQWQGAAAPATFGTDFPGAIQLSVMFGVSG